MKYIIPEITVPWKEQFDLIKHYKDTGCKNTKLKIISANVKLVTSIIKRKYNYPFIYDDLMQEGIIGISKAIDKYDISRGIRFNTFAFYLIRNRLFDFIRFNTNLMSADRGITFSSMDDELNVVYNVESKRDDFVGRDEITFALSHLNDEEKSVFFKKFVNGKKFSRLKKCESVVLESGLNKMRNAITASRSLKYNLT